MRNKSQSWLVGRVNTLLSRMKSAIIWATKKEQRALHELEQQYGTLRVLLAFHEFLDRDRGFDDLTYPIGMFVGQAGAWVARALKCANYLDGYCERNRAVLPPFKDLCVSYSYPSDRQSLLLIVFLAMHESRIDDYSQGHYDMKAVEDFLRSSPVVVQMAPDDHETDVPIPAPTNTEAM